MFCISCGVVCIEEANFCHECGSRINVVVHDFENNRDNIDNIIEGYFYRGYRYLDIVSLLAKHHGVQIHVRTLKRKLKDLGLRRRETDFNEETVRMCIEKEMQDAGSLAGYRYIWHALRLRHRLIVPRGVVSAIMREIDIEGVRERKARRLRRRTYVSFGPNFAWHIDGMFILVSDVISYNPVNTPYRYIHYKYVLVQRYLVASMKNLKNSLHFFIKKTKVFSIKKVLFT